MSFVFIFHTVLFTLFFFFFFFWTVGLLWIFFFTLLTHVKSGLYSISLHVLPPSDCIIRSCPLKQFVRGCDCPEYPHEVTLIFQHPLLPLFLCFISFLQCMCKCLAFLSFFNSLFIFCIAVLD